MIIDTFVSKESYLPYAKIMDSLDRLKIASVLVFANGDEYLNMSLDIQL
jgi:hypothetical protein